MKKCLFFLCLFILGVVFCPRFAHATVYWEDDFEIPLTQAGRWIYSLNACSGSPCPYVDISTDVAHGGTHSLKVNYHTAFGQTQNLMIIRAIPQTDPTLFTRFYYRTHTFSYDATTLFSPADLSYFYPNMAVVKLPAAGAMTIAVQTGEDCVSPGMEDCYANWNATANRAMINLNDNQWHCIETETTMNTPGSANAVLRLWVNGALTVEYTNFRLRGTSVSGPNGNSSLSGFNAILIYHGGLDPGSEFGLMYFDQFAVGTTRIGCLEPLTSFASLSPADLSWTEFSMNNVTGFNIYRGVDSVCAGSAPLPLLVSIVGPMTTYFDNTIQPTTTTVCYEVTAYNSVGESGRSNRAKK